VLEIVLAQSPSRRRPTIVADTPGSISAAVARALTASAVSCTRLVFAGPPHTTAPETLRRWHRDLWNGFDPSDRRRVVLVAGSSAQYSAPVLGEATPVVAFVEDAVNAAVAIGLKPLALAHVAEKRSRAAVLVNAQSRALLGPWYDLAEFPVGKSPPPDADEWRAALFEDVLARISAVPSEQASEEAAKIAGRLRWFEKVTLRYLESSNSSRRAKLSDASRDQIASFCWLDGELRERVVSAVRASR
jgi:hypothetical protein